MLPKNITPTYTIKLPISDQVIDFRPWVSVENKKYLTSILTKDNIAIHKAIQEILTACTFDKMDIGELPLADYEFLFTQVKAKSKDEILYLNYNASVEEDGISDIIPIEFNLLDIEITPIPEKKIPLTDKLGIMMKFPSLNLSRKIDETDDEFEKIAYLVDFVYDDKQIFDSSDFTFIELTEWLKNLTEKQLAKLIEFIENIPTIKAFIRVYFPHSEKRKEIVLKGLSDFFL